MAFRAEEENPLAAEGDFQMLVVCLRKSEFRQAASEGDVYAQYQLGAILLQEGKYEECAGFFRHAASQGDSDALVALGVCFEFGKGVPEDLTLAEWHYRLAAQQGNEDAFGCLRRARKKLDDERAEWLKTLAEKGVGDAVEGNLLEGGSKSAFESELSAKLAKPVRFHFEI